MFYVVCDVCPKHQHEICVFIHFFLELGTFRFKAFTRVNLWSSRKVPEAPISSKIRTAVVMVVRIYKT